MNNNINNDQPFANIKEDEPFSHIKTIIKAELDCGESADTFFEVFQKFKRSMTLYHCAIREIRTKFEVLNDELSVIHERNPIQAIYSRVKSIDSIAAKLRRLNVKFTIDNMQSNLNDIAGVRVICQYIDDIYTVADMLSRQDDINVVNIKDYIKNPKENGYRSYHMIVEVPVFFSNAKNIVRVEVQIRTIAMDFWATLEHGIKYKKEIMESNLIVSELKSCADEIYKLDTKMQNLKERIREVGDSGKK